MKPVSPCERVLIVEDDEGVAYLQRQRLERIGYTVTTARNPEDAIDQASMGVDVIVLDYCLGNVTGLDVCEQLKSRGIDLPVVMVTGFSEESTIIRALRSGVRDFVPKASQYLDALATAIDRVLQQQRTEKQLDESEARRRQGQKMEALGQLAGGVAHEFNNLLQIIQGFTECALEESREQPQTCSDLAEVLKTTTRAASLTAQLLAFSRRQPMRMAPVDLQSAMKDLVKMVQPLLGEHIEVRLEVEEPLGFVLGDLTMIGQAIMNLCVNARDAMPDGGRLTIECTNVVIDETLDQASRPLKPGSYVRVRVSDTGTGIAPEHLARLFEPFFTTKPIGQGTGLGLATVFGVVEEHAGTIEVESEIGQGTSFTLYLLQTPLAPGVDVAEPIQSTHGAETILVAEDEPGVRHFLQRVLSEAGYQVLVARDGVETVDVFRDHQDKIDLVLLDMVLPKQLGRATYDAIQAIRPHMKAAFISGCDPEACHFDFLAENVLLLQKPIRKQDLLQAVRQLLDSSPPRRSPQRFEAVREGVPFPESVRPRPATMLAENFGSSGEEVGPLPTTGARETN